MEQDGGMEQEGGKEQNGGMEQDVEMLFLEEGGRPGASHKMLKWDAVDWDSDL